jgi:hypothetical protein
MRGLPHHKIPYLPLDGGETKPESISLLCCYFDNEKKLIKQKSKNDGFKWLMKKRTKLLLKQAGWGKLQMKS